MWEALRNRLAGGSGPMQGLDQMSQIQGPSLVNAFKRMKGLINPQMQPAQKYMRDSMSGMNMGMNTSGANTPTAYGDVSSAMAKPYSMSSPSRMMQKPQFGSY